MGLPVVNKSGFMTGELFALWIRTLPVPWVNKRRTNPYQHTLLICDTHSSRMNESARAALKEAFIVIIIFPSHVTSMHHRLDFGV